MKALRSRAGRLLYRQLPEEYRYRDRRPDGSPGDLAAYLDGFGEVLDAVRATLEQLYADAFAEAVELPSEDDESGMRSLGSQSWVAPYLSDLLGAELTGPTPDVRRVEVERAVKWFKEKGTVGVVDEIADRLVGGQTMLVEDWRRCARTPRVSAPMSLPADRDAIRMTLAVTPDLQRPDRAVLDEREFEPLRELPSKGGGKRYWRPLHDAGAPWFHRGYQDGAKRTPDLRTGVGAEVGPHPERAHVFVRPPWGLFEPELPEIAWPSFDDLSAVVLFRSERTNAAGEVVSEAVDLLTSFATGLPGEIVRDLRDPDLPDEERPLLITPEVIWLLEGNPLDGDEAIPRRIRMKGSLEIPSGRPVYISELLATGEIKIDAGAAVRMDGGAVKKLTVPNELREEPSVSARHSLFETIEGDGFVRLEHCTVTGDCRVTRVQASDCIFAGEVPKVDCRETNPLRRSCIRYSCLARPGDAAEQSCLRSSGNTADLPRFVRYFAEVDGRCELRMPAFGEPGCGVLDATTPSAIAMGAELSGEMGAYHRFAYSARLEAVRRKLVGFVPFGVDVVVGYDPHLTLDPPEARP